jgi:hypothetical protein
MPLLPLLLELHVHITRTDLHAADSLFFSHVPGQKDNQQTVSFSLYNSARRSEMLFFSAKRGRRTGQDRTVRCLCTYLIAYIFFFLSGGWVYAYRTFLLLLLLLYALSFTLAAATNQQPFFSPSQLLIIYDHGFFQYSSVFTYIVIWLSINLCYCCRQTHSTVGYHNTE